MTAALDALRVAAESPNVIAFLRLIRERESGQGDEAFTVINGGAHFDDFSRHPFHDVPTTRGGKAAGAFQFLGTTWAHLVEQYGFPDFSPYSQTLGAVALIQGRHALSDVLAGDIESAIAECRPEWTSLPSAAESSSSWTMAKALACYQKWGGKLTPTERATPAPIEDRSREHVPEQPEQPMAEDTTASVSSWDWSSIAKVGGGIASIFNPLVGAAIMALSPLLQQKIQAEVGRHTDPETAKNVAANLSDVITKVVSRETGEADPFKAVVAMQANPAVVAKVEAAVVSRLDEMAPFLDKLHTQSVAEWDAEESSKDKAAARIAADPVQGGTIQLTILRYTLWIMAGVLVYVGSLIGYQMYLSHGAEPNGQLLILFVMLATMTANVYRSIADWGYGSSKSSAAKDITVAELSRKK